MGTNTRAEKRRILLIYRRMIPSIRLCGHAQMENLAARGKTEYRAIQEMRLKASDLAWADLVLLGRLDSWYELQIVKKLHNAGKYLIYVMDDDLLNVPKEVSSSAYYNQTSIHQCIREIIGLSDAILSPSPVLLEKYAKGKQAILTEEPSIRPVSFQPHIPGQPIRIGFAGSVDRSQDIESILRETLTAVKREYGNRVAFVFFGAEPSFAGEIGARCIPYTESYEKYRETLNTLAWDIGLAPMPDTPFHACKHYNKFTEYAAAGIAGIYSNVEPYRRLTAFDGCAILCDNTAEAWTAAIRKLICDDKAREAMREKAAECAQGVLSIGQCADKLFAQIRDCGNRDTGVIQGPLLPLKAVNIGKRFMTSLRGHGPVGFIRHGMKIITQR